MDVLKFNADHCHPEYEFNDGSTQSFHLRPLIFF